MTAGSLMAAELAEQPQVLGRLVNRHVADRDQVRAVLPGRRLPGRLAGTVLLARGSSDNVAVYGRYLNEAASPLTGVCDLTLLTGAGPELAVPATKTVTAQMLAIAAIAAAYDPDLVTVADLGALPDEASALLADSADLGVDGAPGSGPAAVVAARWANAHRLVVTGRGLAYAAALETALKIKESARVHAEGLSSADLLHGPIAALDSRLPVLEVTGPILATIRGQQLALTSALLRGLDPDTPAGLSKVTATH